MKPLFPENPGMSAKLYQFIKFNNKREECVDLDTFISTCTIFFIMLKMTKTSGNINTSPRKTRIKAIQFI